MESTGQERAFLLERDYRSITGQSIPSTKAKQALSTGNPEASLFYLVIRVTVFTQSMCQTANCASPEAAPMHDPFKPVVEGGSVNSAEMQRVNRVKQALQQGGVAIGAIMQLASPELVEMAGRNGCDFVIIDCEHGSFYLEGAAEMIRAADAVGITPLVRVPNSDPSYIMRALDSGAMGVVVPNVSTLAQTRIIVSAARYKVGDNGGSRGTCPGTRATWHQTGNWSEFVRWSNENIMVWALIESAAGIGNIDEILSVPMLDAIMMGAFDLAHDMGYPGESLHPKVTEALEGVVSKARDKGVAVVANFFSTSPEGMAQERNRWLAKGVRILSIGSDRRLIHSAMAKSFQAAKGA
ncbi:MAG: aldolase [Betaproteobacteria bacterium]|nr:aldolase [Betaproteobacteria bacterium]MBI3056930.1 aldolase [Betaproteobacteria bacterium]